jgi:hypothetical protein
MSRCRLGARDHLVRRRLYAPADTLYRRFKMELPIRRGEILSLRAAARNLYGAVEALAAGDVSKYVLLDSKNDMRAVLLTPEAYGQLLADAEPVDSVNAREAA